MIASFTEIIDFNTLMGKTSVLALHTPDVKTAKKMMPGLFQTFRKYKYLGASVRITPQAGALPLDPLGVSANPSDAQMDPRDVFNPILFRGCHGEDLGSIMNNWVYSNANNDFSGIGFDFNQIGADGGSSLINADDILTPYYYRCLVDKHWKKVDPNRGFSKGNFRPLVYQLASTRPLNPVSMDSNDVFGINQAYGTEMGSSGALSVTGVPEVSIGNDGFPVTYRNNIQFLTPRLTTLGWMDTRQNLGPITPPSSSTVVDGLKASEGYPSDPDQNDALDLIGLSYLQGVADSFNPVALPKLFMGVWILPPAQSTPGQRYFRASVVHRFAFKDLRGISEVGDYSFSESDRVVGGLSPYNNITGLDAVTPSNPDGDIMVDLIIDPARVNKMDADRATVFSDAYIGADDDILMLTDSEYAYYVYTGTGTIAAANYKAVNTGSNASDYPVATFALHESAATYPNVPICIITGNSTMSSVKLSLDAPTFTVNCGLPHSGRLRELTGVGKISGWSKRADGDYDVSVSVTDGAGNPFTMYVKGVVANE